MTSNKPLYVVLEITDDEAAEMVEEVMRVANEDGKVSLNVGPYRFTSVNVQRVGTVSP